MTHSESGSTAGCSLWWKPKCHALHERLVTNDISNDSQCVVPASALLLVVSRARFFSAFCKEKVVHYHQRKQAGALICMSKAFQVTMLALD